MSLSHVTIAFTSHFMSSVSVVLPFVYMCAGSAHICSSRPVCMSKLKLAFMQRGPTYIDSPSR
jgi:hypothetical protein